MRTGVLRIPEARAGTMSKWPTAKATRYEGSGGVGFDTGTTGGVIGQGTVYNALNLLPATAAGGTVASFLLSGSGVSIQARRACDSRTASATI